MGKPYDSQRTKAYTTMQVITISIFFIVLAMAATNQASPAPAEARGGCIDDYPSWCKNSFKNPRYRLCELNSHLCKLTCGKCEVSDADKDDPCYCDGPRCELY